MWWSGGEPVDEAEWWLTLAFRRRHRSPIVVTNGCLDGLHPGHVSTLRFAADQGRTLVVLVNSDASVRRLKGPGRPLFPAAHRAGLVAALRWVDLVAVFESDTPAELIRRIRPDKLVKGEQYMGTDVAGSEFAGEIIFAPMIPGLSTSSLIAKMNGPTRR